MSGSLGPVIEAILFVAGDPVRIDALAHAMKLAPSMSPDQVMIICLSGRGDKDVAAIARYRGVEIHD